MRLVEFCARIFVDWSVLACIVAGAYAVAMCRLKRRREQSFTDWTLDQPPVPTQADIDATWLSAWPSAVDDDALCDAEFVSLISTTWEWPDREDAS